METITKIEKTIIEITPDEWAESPCNESNFGTVIAFHRKYQIGHPHTYKTPLEFAIDLLKNTKISVKRLESLIPEDYKGEYKYYLSDKYRKRTPEDIIYFMEEYLPDNSEKIVENILAVTKVVCLPLYMYDHSGIALSTTPFSCRWDSGQIGYVYVSKEKIKETYKYVNKKTIDKAVNILKHEIETIDHYVNGNVWKFSIKNDDVIVDSCGGFYGDDIEVSGMLDYIPAKLHDKAREAWNNRF